VPEKVFRNNIKFVTENIPLLQEFVSTTAKESGLENFAYYDLFMDEKISGDITIEQGQKIMLSALAPLGEDYIKRVKQKLTDKSIDYLPNKDKTSGAYCSNSYNAKTLILMNWVNDFDSISTLSHEMGHCINAEYFNEFQPLFKAEIPIIAAEIASIVNEILLNQHMLKNCNENEKAYYLKEFLPESKLVKGDLNIDDLFNAYMSFIKQQKLSKPLNTKITKKEINVEDKIKEIRQILDKKSRINFLELFDDNTKQNVVVTFLSILEMCKIDEIILTQEDNFSPIMIEKRV
jgi:hypothetical protein